MRYEEIKAEALTIAKGKGACADQYRRAAKAEDLGQLAQVMKDNFRWCCNAGLLTPDTIVRWGLRDHGITANEDVSSGYCLATGNATVTAWGSATVRAGDSAVVTAGDSAYIHAPYDAIKCTLHDKAIMRHNNTITAANGQTITL